MSNNKINITKIETVILKIQETINILQIIKYLQFYCEKDDFSEGLYKKILSCNERIEYILNKESVISEERIDLIINNLQALIEEYKKINKENSMKNVQEKLNKFYIINNNHESIYDYTKHISNEEYPLDSEKIIIIINYYKLYKKIKYGCLVKICDLIKENKIIESNDVDDDTLIYMANILNELIHNLIIPENNFEDIESKHITQIEENADLVKIIAPDIINENSYLDEYFLNLCILLGYREKNLSGGKKAKTYKKSPAKKSPVKKSPVKKSPIKKSPVKKSPAKKSPTKK